jgi:hypothetical protein
VVSKRPIKRIENPSWLTLPATRGLNRPPARTQLQLLPFQELEWENFERLCYRLAKTRGDVEQWAALYGSRGQKQDGIDIYARRPDARLYSCWQSKRYKHLTPALLKAAIAEFEKGAWVAKSEEFVICSSASIQDTNLQKEIEAQTSRLLGNNLRLTVLGQTELSTELKDRSSSLEIFSAGSGFATSARTATARVQRTPWMLPISPSSEPSLGNSIQAVSSGSIRGY